MIKRTDTDLPIRLKALETTHCMSGCWEKQWQGTWGMRKGRRRMCTGGDITWGAEDLFLYMARMLKAIICSFFSFFFFFTEKYFQSHWIPQPKGSVLKNSNKWKTRIPSSSLKQIHFLKCKTCWSKKALPNMNCDSLKSKTKEKKTKNH